MTSVLVKRGNLEADTGGGMPWNRGDGHLQAKEKGSVHILPSRATEEDSPVGTVGRGLLEQWENKFLLFNPPSLLYFVMATQAN